MRKEILKHMAIRGIPYLLLLFISLWGYGRIGMGAMYALKAGMSGLIFLLIWGRPVRLERQNQWLLTGIMVLHGAGDLILYPDYHTPWFLAALICMGAAKVLLCLILYQHGRMSILQSLPVIILAVGIDLYLMLKLYDYMGYFVYPILLYMILYAAALQGAWMRKSAVNRSTYVVTLIAMLLFIVAESLTAFIQFKFRDTLLSPWALFFSGLAHIFLVCGLILEKQTARYNSYPIMQSEVVDEVHVR